MYKLSLFALPISGELLAMAVVTYWFGHFGEIALAASQIVWQYEMFMVMIVLGLAQALSILVSNAYEQQNVSLVKAYVNAAYGLIVILVGIVMIVFGFFPAQLTHVFLHQHPVSGQLMHLARYFFFIAIFGLGFDALRNVLAGALRGLQYSQVPMIIGNVCLWLIGLPLGYVFAFILHGGPLALSVGFTVGFIIGAIWLWFKLQKKLSHLAY
jgi:MATE family multidrug resistance protein